MQTAKHPLDTPRTNVAPTPAPKTKAKSKGKTVDGLIDADRAVAASRVVAGSDGGKTKAKTAPAKTSKAKKSKAKAAKPKKAAKAKPAMTRPGLRDPFPGSLTAAMVKLLQRRNGASLNEIVKTRPSLRGATPHATVAAEISRLKPFWKIERVGEGKGEARRFKITGRRK